MNNETKDILKEHLRISRDIILLADEYARNSGEQFESCLVDLGIIERLDLIGFMANQYGIKAVDLEEIELPTETVRIVTEGIARGYSLIPFCKEEDQLFVAISNTGNMEAIKNILKSANYEKSYYIELYDDIMRSLDKVYVFSDMPTSSGQSKELQTALIRRSRYSLQRRRYEAALSDIKKAIDCCSDGAIAHSERNRVLQEIIDNIEALKDTDQQILNYPSEVHAYNEKMAILKNIKGLCSFLVR
ncbi:MAG: hypothetical protein JW803_04325 [Endomicrobiales bacterium]|nr:hypothetical protein [Endomicrobiales bacterium]